MRYIGDAEAIRIIANSLKGNGGQEVLFLCSGIYL